MFSIFLDTTTSEPEYTNSKTTDYTPYYVGFLSFLILNICCIYLSYNKKRSHSDSIYLGMLELSFSCFFVLYFFYFERRGILGTEMFNEIEYKLKTGEGTNVKNAIRH